MTTLVTARLAVEKLMQTEFILKSHPQVHSNLNGRSASNTNNFTAEVVAPLIDIIHDCGRLCFH